MLEFVTGPWPPWLSGILIGLIVPLLYLFAGKAFGISTSFQQMGAMCAPHSRWEYLSKYDWRGGMWTLVFALGIGLGGFLAAQVLAVDPPNLLPQFFERPSGILKLLGGGFLIGFGTRYAGGCTSGHSITGISNLNPPSLLATICFFAGGLAITWGLGSWLFTP